MPTKKPRINITFEEKTAGVLVTMARQEHKSLSNLAKELILEALERREDRALSEIAERCDSKDLKTVSHEDAWK